MRSKSFDVKVVVYQGSVLNPILFVVVMDEVKNNIKKVSQKNSFMQMTLYYSGGLEEVETRYYR